MPLLIPISWGELFDKITILEIKANRITEEIKLNNINNELHLLSGIADQVEKNTSELQEIISQLRMINEQLWDIEDEIRICESKKNFTARFIELARSVYITNDKRAQLKYQINQLLGSDLVEEKSYTHYKT